MKSKYTLGIRAGYLVPMNDQNQYFENYFIGIHDDKITTVQPFKKNMISHCHKFLNLEHQIVMPGLINTHTHLAMTLLRGIEDNLNLQDWLFTRIFPLEGQFVNKKFVEVGTRLAAFECIRFGTTTVSDMYFYPETALKVWDTMGLRGVFGQPMISFPSPESADGNNDLLFKKFDQLFKKYQNHNRLQVSLAPHAPYTCTPELLKQVQEKQQQTGCLVHIHVAETQAEVKDVKTRFSATPVEHLKNIGLLNPRTVMAHVVHTNTKDQKLMAQSGAHVLHNPDSNFKLGSGIAPVTDYLKQNINVALGTDGVASNNDLSLFGAMDLMAKAQKVNATDISKFTTWMALNAATTSGAQALGLSKQVGQIAEDYLADIISVDTQFAHLTPISDPSSHLVFSTQGLEVDTTIVAGKILMQNKKFKVPGFEQTLKEAQRVRVKIKKFLETPK